MRAAALTVFFFPLHSGRDAPLGHFSTAQREMGTPAKPNEVGLLGKGGARKRAEGARRKPEAKRTLRRRVSDGPISVWTEMGERTNKGHGPL